MKLGDVFVLLGFLVGGAIYLWEGKRLGKNDARFQMVALVGALAGSAAAIVIQLFANVSSVSSPAARTVIGGVLGGWVAVEVVKRKLGLKQSTGPMWALALPAGEAVGRIGCWFHQCCYGDPYSGPLAVFCVGQERYPTQFMLAGAAALNFGVVYWLRDRVSPFPLYLAMWGGSRALIEPLRANHSNFAIGAGVAICIYGVWRIREFKKVEV